VKASFAVAVLSLALVAGARSQSVPPPPSPDPRIGLRAGWMDAATAAWNIRLVSTTPPSSQFVNPASPGDFALINSDLAFVGPYVFQGNFSGYQIWDITNPAQPTLVTAYKCPGSQSDVSVFRKLAFVSGEAFNGRVDCGTQGVQDTVSHERLRGIRIFDVTDITHPRYITNVQTCRGSHTHTVVTSPRDTANVYIYVSGSAPVRSPHELEGCSDAPPDSNPNTALFRIEVIQVPLAAPEQAHIVSSPRIFQDLAQPPRHGEAPEDVAAAKRAVDSAKAAGGFVGNINGRDIVMSPQFVTAQLDSIVKARGGTGAPTGADTATLRASLNTILAARFTRPRRQLPPGPTQCHDITVYPAIGRAGGACGGYGLLLDITDPANPKRIGAAADSNFSFWHSATFNNDGSKVLFTDEWGGGLQPRCRVTDKPEWGADAIFTLKNDTMAFQSYYKLPVAQTPNENCVAHNGSLIPVPGRDIMAQGWYQGGISVFDWTDAAHPKEIAFFDRGPMDSTKLVGAGSWSAYWYNGYIVSSEIARGLDIFELQPSELLSANEIAAAKLVHFDYLNAQDQQQIVWPASYVVVYAYLDQLERNNGLAADRIKATRTALNRSEQIAGSRRSALTKLAAQLNSDAAGARDPAKVRAVAAEVTRLAATR
jgi:hypothetical protein